MTYAMREALSMVLEEVLDARIKRHHIGAEATREAAKTLGLDLFAREGDYSNTLTAINMPEGVTDNQLRGTMRNKYQIELAGGQDHLKGNIFRIGHMGTTGLHELAMTFACLEMTLKEFGFEFESGAGVAALEDIYLKNFKKTQIISMTDDAAILKYNIGDGAPRVGMRRDGVGSPSHFKTWIGSERYSKIPNMGEVWKYRPIVFESFQSVDKMKSWGWDILFSLNWMLENHVSIVNEGPFQPHQIKEGTPEAEALRNVDLYAGARLVPQSANFVYRNGKLDVKIVGVNKGVAKIYLPYEFVYEVRGADGGLVAEKVSQKDPRSILTGEFEISDSFDVSLENGKDYAISLRVRNIAKVLRDFRFAAKNLNLDGSLPLGKISLK